MKLSKDFNKFIDREVQVKTTQKTIKVQFGKEEYIKTIAKVDENDATLKALFELAAKHGYRTRVFIAPGQTAGTMDFCPTRLNITLAPTNGPKGYGIRHLDLG